MKRLKELMSVIESQPQGSQLDPLLPHINSQLDNVLAKVKANIARSPAENSSEHTFTQQENIPPNKHNITQPRFKPTVKKPGRHISERILR